MPSNRDRRDRVACTLRRSERRRRRFGAGRISANSSPPVRAAASPTPLTAIRSALPIALQDLVAVRVPVRVVDRLEVVDIDHHECEPPVAAAGHARVG